MRLTVPGFSGVVRIVAPQRLEDHQAQVAVDCDFRSGDLRPYYGDGSTGYSGPSSGTASMFLYEQDHLIATAGDLNFARSPVFFSSSSNDRRVFYADNTLDEAYPLVLESFSGSGALPEGAKRLGVPKPDPIVFTGSSGEELVDYAEQAGTLTKAFIRTYADTEIFIPKAEAKAANLSSGIKLLLEAPGFSSGQIARIKTIGPDGLETTATDYKATLENDKRTWKLGTLLLTKDETTVRFKADGHGFIEDDLVLFSHVKDTTPAKKFPTTNLGGDNVNLARPFKVVNATYNTFELQYYTPGTGWTTLALTTASGATQTFTTVDGVVSKQVARIASASLVFSDDTLPTVTLVPDGSQGPFVGTALVSYTNITTAWSNAATADTVMDRSYCLTYVNEFGDESEPSLPTKTLSVVPGSPVTFNTGAIKKTADAHYATPTEIRLYRTDALGTFRLVTTDSGGSGANKISYATVDTASPVYVDNYPDTELGEPLSTTGWSVPVAGLKGLVNCPNGIVAGFRGRTIFGSVPYAPYAWPIANQVATDYDVVGLVPTSAGLVVVTKGMPSILIGDNPASWSMQKLEYPQGCVTRRSIVDMGEFAMYASPDGLVAIAGANVEILTQSIMTREQWQAYNPSSIIAAQVEGRYIASYFSGGSRKGFIYDPQTQSFTDLTLTAVAFCNDLLEDKLLMLNPGGAVVAWNQNTAAWKPYQWHSKWFQLPIPELMGVAQIFTTTIDLTGRALTFKLYGYDNNATTKIYEISTTTSPDAILGNRPFRLPYVAPGRFTAYKIILEGSIPVGTVMLGRVMDEMKEAP